MKRILKVGDRVLWKGGWNSQPARLVKVEAIDRVDPLGSRDEILEGYAEIDWHTVLGADRSIIVSLETGNWAYAYQIRPDLRRHEMVPGLQSRSWVCLDCGEYIPFDGRDHSKDCPNRPGRDN